MKRSHLVAASLMLLIGAFSFARPVAPASLVPFWTTTGPLGGRIKDIEGDLGGNLYVGGEAMTPHSGVPTGWNPISELAGLPPNTRDFGRTTMAPAFVLAANWESDTGTGGVFLTDNGGVSWTEQTSGLPVKGKNYRAAAVDPIAVPLDMVAGNSDVSVARRGIYATHDGGASWKQNLPGGVVNALDWGPAALPDVFAATSVGTYRSTDNGDTWVLVDGGAPTLDVVVDPNGQMVLAVRSNEVRRSPNGGPGSWAGSAPPGVGYDLRAITRPHSVVGVSNVVFVAGAATTAGPAGLQDGDGVLYRSNDFGATWSTNLATYAPAGPFPRHNPFDAVAYDATNNGNWLHVGLDTGGLYWSQNAQAVPATAVTFVV